MHAPSSNNHSIANSIAQLFHGRMHALVAHAVAGIARDENDVYPQIGSAPRIIRSCCQAGQHLVPSTRPALVDAATKVTGLQVDSNRTSRQLLEHSYRFCRRTWGQPNDRRICHVKLSKRISAPIAAQISELHAPVIGHGKLTILSETSVRPSLAAIAFSNSSLPIAAKSLATQSSSRFISSTPLVQLFQKARSIFLNDFLLRNTRADERNRKR